MINVKNLHVKYGSLHAVNDVSFSVQEGEAFGIIGRNGAGKTTLVETMEGLREKSGGTIEINGIDPSNRSKKEELYSLVSVQLQSTNYPEKAKVGELCRLFSSFCSNPMDTDALLRKFDLLEKFKSPVSNLSGGQKQKLSILLALISRPKVIFLDELTTGLDADARHELWKALKELKRDGVTIVLVTHFMDDVEMLCDRVGIMREGRLINVGTKDELVSASGLAKRLTFTCGVEVEPKLKALDGAASISYLGDQYTVVTGRGDFPEACLDLFARENIPYKDFIVSRPTMEDVFLKLVNKPNGRDLIA